MAIIDTTEHTDRCKHLEAEFKKYETKWPSFCKRCFAAGAIDASDPSVGLWDSEPCPDCFAKGICARCACRVWKFSDANDNSSYECLSCGWNDSTEGAPYYECSCWERNIDATQGRE